jgi:hypothetical protein
MKSASQHLPVVVAIALMACGLLGGCGTVNSYLATGFEDVIPTWAGGLPADAPPRPGTQKYDEFMRQRELQRLQPAAKKDDTSTTSSATTTPSSPSAQGPVN